MKRPRRRAREAPVQSPAEELRVEALTVAMALAPGVYARNRMFDLSASAAVQRAKARAASLRGIVKQLARAREVRLERNLIARDVATAAGVETSFELRYAIPEVSLSRVVELSRVELAALRVLAFNAQVTALPLDATDRALVDGSLSRLLVAGGDTGGLARAARDRTTPSSPPSS